MFCDPSQRNRRKSPPHEKSAAADLKGHALSLKEFSVSFRLFALAKYFMRFSEAEKLINFPKKCQKLIGAGWLEIKAELIAFNYFGRDKLAKKINFVGQKQRILFVNSVHDSLVGSAMEVE